MKPEAAMRLALREARRVEGRTFPNPSVGAVLFRGDTILGKGGTRPAGGPHAEIVAIRRALRRFGDRSLRGAAMAATLEPCCHVGRTGPCVDAILEAGVRRVFVGHTDPHPDVAGRGIRRLRRAGVRVVTGVLEDECRAAHRGFLSVCERGRPFAMLKLASTLDGRIATAAGESRWITGPEARAAVHRLRARVDAIVVGSGTVLADAPELTARRGDRVIHRPVRVLVDSVLRVPAMSRFYRSDAENTWVLCGASAAAGRRRALESRGVRVLDVPLRDGHPDPKRVAARLAREGLTQILIEGGGVLAAAWLRARLVDEAHWFVAPRVLGGDGRAALGALEIEFLIGSPFLEARVGRIGRDVYLRGEVRYPADRRGRAKRRRASR